MLSETKHLACEIKHVPRSAGNVSSETQILRCAQDDKKPGHDEPLAADSG